MHLPSQPQIKTEADRLRAGLSNLGAPVGNNIERRWSRRDHHGTIDQSSGDNASEPAVKCSERSCAEQMRKDPSPSNRGAFTLCET